LKKITVNLISIPRQSGRLQVDLADGVTLRVHLVVVDVDELLRGLAGVVDPRLLVHHRARPHDSHGGHTSDKTNEKLIGLILSYKKNI